MARRRDAVSVGSVLSRAFALIAAAPVPVLGLSLLLGAMPRVLLEWGIGSLTRTDIGSTQVVMTLAAWSGSSIVGIMLSTFVQGAITRAALAAADGRRIGIGWTLAGTIGMLPALLVVAIISSLGISLGYALLFVPGMLLATIWAVAAPAIVAERMGPFAGLARSRWLTRGHRWTVFGLLTLIFVLSWVASGVWTVVVVHSLGITGGIVGGARPTVTWLLSDLAFKTMTTAVWASARAALYVELRDAREGPTQARLATIFA